MYFCCKISGLGFLRTILGFSLVFATRNIFKSFAINVSKILYPTAAENTKGKNFNKSPREVFIELATIYTTYFLVGLNTVYTIPVVFRFLRIERPTFYTEI